MVDLEVFQGGEILACERKTKKSIIIQFFGYIIGIRNIIYSRRLIGRVPPK